MQRIYDYNGEAVDVSGLIAPEAYGASGDGVKNDSAAIQSAVNSGKTVLFGAGKRYKVIDTIRLPKGAVLDLNGATIISSNKHLFYNFENNSTYTGYNGNGDIVIRNGRIIGGAISLAHAENVLLENIDFRNSINDYFLEICACRDYRVIHCSFTGMLNLQNSVLEYINIDPCLQVPFPWLPSGSAFYDGKKNDRILIEGCRFTLGEGDYAYGFNAVGVHGLWNESEIHRNIRLLNNRVTGFTGCGFRLNDMAGVYVMGNDIRVAGDGIRVGDVAACEDVVIMDNYVTSENGEKLAVTVGRCTDLTVAGNVTKGERQEF